MGQGQLQHSPGHSEELTATIESRTAWLTAKRTTFKPVNLVWGAHHMIFETLFQFCVAFPQQLWLQNFNQWGSEILRVIDGGNSDGGSRPRAFSCLHQLSCPLDAVEMLTGTGSTLPPPCPQGHWHDSSRHSDRNPNIYILYIHIYILYVLHMGGKILTVTRKEN